MIPPLVPKLRYICSVSHVAIPAHMEDAGIRLRLLRLSDGRFIINGLKDEITLDACGMRRPINSSWLSLWWWLKKTFTPAYCIEFDSRPIGFIGLYDLIPGESAEISLAMFDKTFRRKGYGSRAFNLLAQHLQRHSVIREIRAEVARDNRRALLFWRTVGFLKLNSVDDKIINMSMDLNSNSIW